MRNKPSMDQLADLSPNMRSAIWRAKKDEGWEVKSYWITLQSLVQRGLVTNHQWKSYTLTKKGRAWRKHLKKHYKLNINKAVIEQ